jgi:hypothetical protein
VVRASLIIEDPDLVPIINKDETRFRTARETDPRGISSFSGLIASHAITEDFVDPFNLIRLRRRRKKNAKVCATQLSSARTSVAIKVDDNGCKNFVGLVTAK